MPTTSRVVGNPDNVSELKTSYAPRVLQPLLQRGYAESFMLAGNSSFQLARALTGLWTSVALSYSNPSPSILKTWGLTSFASVIACDNLVFSLTANSASSGSE